MKYLGIDLGTANTYIYGFSGAGLPSPLILHGLADSSGSMATAVLYEDGKPILAGNAAEAEYYSQPALQSRRRLAIQFKPELALAEPVAMRACADFLRLAREAMPQGALEVETVVTVGMPSLAREDYSLNLRQCFVQAGWPEPSFARESDAALVSCLQSGSLNADDIARKCLILDFGGGTCDYTSVESLEVLQNGGDVLYGGRLFDDLFYQAFCRANPDFARESPDSPYAWHAHWLECRAQKEKFSDYMASNADSGKISLRIVWYDASAKKREAFLHNYGKEEFLADAENYCASPQLLAMLSPYVKRGGLSGHARDLLEGRQIGLASWLKAIMESVERRREVSCVVLTGGSSRWFFVPEFAADLFAAARIAPSHRGYEDIAFGLSMYPLLSVSQKRAEKLLREKLESFTASAAQIANGLVEKHARKIARFCSERIVDRDVMPALEAAQKESFTAAALEEKFAANIRADAGLREIVDGSSENLAREIQSGLNFAFRRWLNENGVPMAPGLQFPAQSIGQDFLKGITVKISRLDSLNLMSFTLQNILPIIAATATAGAIAHSGEPVSTVLGGGAAFGLTWLMARAAPRLLEQRKLPSFILSEGNRKKIAAKNREYIEKALLDSFGELRVQLALDIERRVRDALTAMLGSLSALNQVRAKESAQNRFVKENI